MAEPNEKRQKTSGKGEVVTPDSMRIYYDRLFPVSLLFQWLGYGDADLIKKREFSFTLKDDVYVRYCCFKTKDEFKSGLLAKTPYKIDIGACFNVQPSMHDSVNNFKPLSKEFVIDIDMTDYDSVRSCCSGADICVRCWPLMTAALKMVDATLRTDFGFKQLLWVYSGRRGIHCWVCDKAARTMTNQARSAVIEYLSVKKLDESKPELTYPLHPALKQGLTTLKKYFEKNLIEAQRLFESEESCQMAVKFVVGDIGKAEADETCRNGINKLQNAMDWENDKDGLTRWSDFKNVVSTLLSQNDKKFMRKYPNIRNAICGIVFKYCYPRLDVNVSKQLNHLLKSPFCVHPKTGNVCVPIDPAKADSFNPFEVPTLDVLLNELNSDKSTEPKTKSWTKTQMKGPIEYFQSFVKDLLEEAQEEKQMMLRQEAMTEGTTASESVEVW